LERELKTPALNKIVISSSGLFLPTLCMFILTVVMSGCASVKTSLNKPPVAIKLATPGTTVMYFFRPDNDTVDRNDRPKLSIDDHPVGTLELGSYTAVSLSPGLHQVELLASAGDSDNWNQKAEFKVDDGITYYVAIWHQNQPRKEPTPRSAIFLGGATGGALVGGATGGALVGGATGGALGGLLAHVIFQSLRFSKGPEAAQFESVDRSVAEFGMAGLNLVPPMDPSMAIH
jgi:hypothetical protein